MKTITLLTITTTIFCLNVNADNLGPTSNRQRIYDQYMSLASSAVLSSNTCNLRSLLDADLYENVKPEVKKIGGCFDGGLENIMAKYANVENLLTNPKFMCETYTLTHSCIRSFIPYLSVCLSNVQNTTVTKLYAGGEIGLSILCENDAEIYSIIYRNRYKKCIKHFLRRYDQKFKNIWGLDEPTLFSSETSCTILSMMTRTIQNRPPHCNEQMARTLKSIIEKFWTNSGCSNVITFA